MTRIVLDASVALAWCFPDETSEDADRILVALEGNTLMVPAVWPLEIANAVLAGQWGHRLREPEIERFLALLEGLSLVQDELAVSDCVQRVLPMAREHSLSAYDAAYLELAKRHGATLATLDKKVRKAAQKAGVPVFAKGT